MTDTPSETEQGLWFITWGDEEIYFTRDYLMVGGVPFVKRHRAVRERINWWLADRVENLRRWLGRLEDALDDVALPLCSLEDRLRGYDD